MPLSLLKFLESNQNLTSILKNQTTFSFETYLRKLFKKIFLLQLKERKLLKEKKNKQLDS